uniref:Orf2 protein n=2 Tax=Cossaviricota TaxID=2732415 RepID=Q86929_9VIRU|nr:orf2 [Bombyx mori bidensovirus 2]ABC70397.1 nonstructural protein [Bombyx mori densovirus 6]
MLRLTDLHKPSCEPKGLSFYAYKAFIPYREKLSKEWNKLPVCIKDQEADIKQEVKEDQLIRKIYKWDSVFDSWNWSKGYKLPKPLYELLEIYMKLWKLDNRTTYPDWGESSMIFKRYRYIRNKRMEDIENLSTEEFNDRNFNGWPKTMWYICRNCFDNGIVINNNSNDYYYTCDFSDNPTLLHYTDYFYYILNNDYWCYDCKYTPLFTLTTLFCLESINDSE